MYDTEIDELLISCPEKCGERLLDIYSEWESIHFNDYSIEQCKKFDILLCKMMGVTHCLVMHLSKMYEKEKNK